MTALCGCMKCFGERVAERMRAGSGYSYETDFPGPQMPGWRYACELCGNKRCPHHSDHALACTNSNATGQPGSLL